MAVPKKKATRAAGRKRRTHWKVKAPALAPCPQCHELKLLHHVCKNCGMYNGKQVLEVETAE
ncbi:MAG: 50S ribosomal protein L32 [Christensenellales bacterium]